MASIAQGVLAPALANDVVLRMAVPDWPPTRIMKDLTDKTYKAPSGNHVTLEPDFIPWPDYYTRLAASLTSGEKKYNMAVSDSQWLGAFIEGGYFLKINKYVDADPGLQAGFQGPPPALKDSYSTHPYKTANLYRLPPNADIPLSSSRTAIFSSTKSVFSSLWQHGGDIWDERKAPASHATGVVNSPVAIQSFEHMLSLLKYMPPVVKTGGLDIFKTDELFREGKVALNVNWIGFAESAITPATSKVADKVAFAQIPGLKTDKGNVKWSVIGGQPFVPLTWNTEDLNKEALDFCKWWLSKETQVAFAKAGGQSALKSGYTDPTYLTFRPWNRAWGPP